MAIQSRYPMDATPPSELFDRVDAEQAINTAQQVLSQVELFDQSSTVKSEAHTSL